MIESSHKDFLSRRDFLIGIAAAGTGAMIAGRLLAQAPAASPRIIDCHHHFMAPDVEKVIVTKMNQNSTYYTNFITLNQWRNWSPAGDVEIMDKQGVQTAILSVTTPGVDFGNADETKTLARQFNEYGAKMVSGFKGRFGLFAVLPLPDIDNTLKEIEYVFDSLKVDGVGLLTSYGTRWLGDPVFQPVFEELNRRNAVVYTHPIDAPCCRELQAGIGPTTFEFPTDTTRAILSLLYPAPPPGEAGRGGAREVGRDGRGRGPAPQSPAERYSNIRFIFSHGGGTLPSVIERIGIGGADTLNDILAKQAAPNSRLAQLRRFYYDTATSTNIVQMQALKTVVGVSQIIFGTDYPFGGDAEKHYIGLKGCGFSAAELQGVCRDNAMKFLPMFKAA
jgi:6-methylsalicylate decarboxylase